MKQRLANTISFYIKELEACEPLSGEYEQLYSRVDDDRLRLLLATLHRDFTNLFRQMNERLPTGATARHYWAEPSRQLRKRIEMAHGLCEATLDSESPLEIDKYYKNVFYLCRKFLRDSGGSELPPHMEVVRLYYELPIFCLAQTVSLSRETVTNAALKLLGRGSYAEAYAYEDPFLHKKIVVKRAHKTLTSKELERFRQEYEVMKKLSSPYIAEVFRYEEDGFCQYYMECLDGTLHKYILKQNNKLTLQQRILLAKQILKGIQYLHNKKILHRDLSPSNILLKIYENCVVVKLADFGLVKVPDSQLTTCHTSVKGAFRDPQLETDGFDNYSLCHEIYALTRIIYFVMTGRENISNLSEPWKAFVEKGTNVRKELRYQDVEELQKAFMVTVRQIQSQLG